MVFGGIYSAKILELLDRGVMVELHPAMDSVLLHNSQLDNRKVSHPSLLGLEPGQDLQLKCYGMDPAPGQVRISRKVFTVGAAMEIQRDLLGAREGDKTGSGMLSMLNLEAAKRRVILESVTDLIFFFDCIIAKSKVRIN